MAKKEEERLHISSPRIIILLSILFLIIEVALFFAFQRFDKETFSLDASFYIYTPIVVILAVFSIIVSIKQTYYVVDKHKIVHVKMGKVYEYYFKDIIFIDEKFSKKHKMLLFYKNNGHPYYLAFDKDGVIYEYALTYSHLISEEEFYERFQKH